MPRPRWPRATSWGTEPRPASGAGEDAWRQGWQRIDPHPSCPSSRLVSHTQILRGPCARADHARRPRRPRATRAPARSGLFLGTIRARPGARSAFYFDSLVHREHVSIFVGECHGVGFSCVSLPFYSPDGSELLLSTITSVHCTCSLRSRTILAPACARQSPGESPHASADARCFLRLARAPPHCLAGTSVR